MQLDRLPIGVSLFWLLATLAVYASSVHFYRRCGHPVWALPVLTGTAAVVGLLMLTGTGYPVYADATRALRWLSGPATIALAVPLYRQISLLRRLMLPLGVALLAGCFAALISSVALARALGASRELALSLAPKSATMPIAMAAAERVGGVPALTAMAVVATGVIGTLVAGPLLRRLQIADERILGFTLGLAAHAIGTARTLQTRPDTVAFAALAMSANGVATALAMAWVPRWL